MHRYNICIYYGHTYIRTDMHTCTWYMNIEDILKPSGLYSIYLHSTLWWRLALVLKTDRRATKSLKFKPSNILSILWTHKKKPKKPRNFAPTLKEIKERNVSSELRKILRFLPETRDWRRIQEQTRTTIKLLAQSEHRAKIYVQIHYPNLGGSIFWLRTFEWSVRYCLEDFVRIMTIFSNRISESHRRNYEWTEFHPIKQISRYPVLDQVSDIHICGKLHKGLKP